MRSWLLTSAGLHGLAALAVWGTMSLHAGPVIVAELDLSMASMAPRPVSSGGGGGAPKPVVKEVWRDVPAPPAPEPAPALAEETHEAPAAEGEQTGEGGGDGSAGLGYIGVNQAARKPRWLRNFITPDDYPRMAREAGKDGRVLLSILIDETGRVREARLLQGAYEALNEVALRKVKEAVFSPAYDAEGNPVACLVNLPIRFELR